MVHLPFEVLAQQSAPIRRENSAAALQGRRQAELEELGERWVYGDGIGTTALNVGTSILFPPYLFVLLGNGALQVAGFEPVGVSSLLEGEQKRDWEEGYSSFVSLPGKLVAQSSGEYYRASALTPRDARNDYLWRTLN